MKTMSMRIAYSAAVLAGALLWGATAAIYDRREAWDVEEYWTLTYPLSIGVAAAVAFLVPHRGAWQFGPMVMFGQLLALVVASRSFGLLPLGLIVFALLAIPPAGAAAVASFLGRRIRGLVG